MNCILDKLSSYGVVPVIVLHRTEDAVPLAEALMKGGLSCAEVTFRTEAAEESIRLISEHFLLFSLLFSTDMLLALSLSYHYSYWIARF